MAFLDRLVSGLVKQSTGYNVRPIVRAVGGKNILLLGGAAVAGMLAAEKMKGQGQAGAPPIPPAPGAPPPPIPPVPGQSAPAPQQSAPPPPPVPVPSSVPAQAPAPVPPVQTSESEIPTELVYAIVRTMVAAALADGAMHENEKSVIQDRLGESGLSAEQTAQVRKDLVLPATPAELSGLVSSSEDKELLYRFGALVVLADDEVTDTEKVWLGQLSSALGLSAPRRSAIDSELFDQNPST